VGGRGRREKAEGGGEYQRRRDLEGGRVNDIQFGDCPGPGGSTGGRGGGGGLGTPRKYGSDGKVVVVARVAKEELKDQLQAMRVRLHGPAGA
jgi:hypothetical protein